MGTRHLREEEFVDLLDGTLAEARAAHLEQCNQCRTQYERARRLMGFVGSADVPEPSPLYWEHFSRQVRERLDAEPARQAWWRFRPMTAGVFVAALLLVMLVARLWSPGGRPPNEPPTWAEIESVDHSQLVADDSTWELLQEVGKDVPWEDAADAGLAPSRSVDYHAFDHLSANQRAELAAYLREEIERAKS